MKSRMTVFDKSKLLSLMLLSLLILCGMLTNNFLISLFAISAFIISANRFVVLKFAFLAVLLFSGVTALANGIMMYYLVGQTDFSHLTTFVWRSFALSYIALAFINRFGVIGVFGINSDARLFLVLFLSKKELFTRMLEESYESAKSKGLNTRDIAGTLKLISSLSATLFVKAIYLSKENSYALKSRGYHDLM
ncbi:MAG: hypothetical protein PHE73_05400 [Sulfurovaceae bacterium]|nr:hypothetical protein [Sulfurovaceae bacterium]